MELILKYIFVELGHRCLQIVWKVLSIGSTERQYIQNGSFILKVGPNAII